MIDKNVLQQLNLNTKDERLASLKKLVKTSEFPPKNPRYINNHIHSTYSFSPYSPTAAAYAARTAGLCTAGIMDHDSMGGAVEFITAGDLIGIPTTVGIEFRVSMVGTPLERRRTNNPDQIGCNYMTLHGVPHGKIADVQSRFTPLRMKRNIRNRMMIEKLNALCEPEDIFLSFDDDVVPLSQFNDGGSVTERHLMLALARKLIAKAGRGPGVITLLRRLGINLSIKQQNLLLNSDCDCYEYDLMGILKSTFVPKIYIDAGEECMNLVEAVEFGNSIGGILCYPYLGDIEESVTGDKAAQKFEDEYLEELFCILNSYGVKAITYMPPRNTREQLIRLRGLCDKHGMYQISGEDINSPRQEFVCRAMDDPIFSNLIDAAWALIDHERGRKTITI